MSSLNESLNDNVLGSREATARISTIDKADGPAALDTAPARHPLLLLPPCPLDKNVTIACVDKYCERVS